MRNSQRVVLGGLVFLVALMLGVAVWISLIAEPTPELSGERAPRSFDYSGFTGVDASGQWEVAIERGDAWRIAIEVPEEHLDDIEVELDGDELTFGYEGECAGCFRDGPSLTVDMSGASELRGAASRFDSLSLDKSGVGNLELGDVTVTNADVDLSGAGNVTLRMGGGRLSGDMSGFGSLEYYGTVSEQTVDSSGFANVRQRD
jgi:hypothetical protein